MIKRPRGQIRNEVFHFPPTQDVCRPSNELITRKEDKELERELIITAICRKLFIYPPCAVMDCFVASDRKLNFKFPPHTNSIDR